jgi:plasmid stability protein
MVSITLDNVPDEVHQALRTRAERSGRTIPREAVECLHSLFDIPIGQPRNRCGTKTARQTSVSAKAYGRLPATCYR